MGKEKLIRFTNLLLGFMFYSGIIVILGLPLILKIAGKQFFPDVTEKFWPMLIIYGLAGICGVTILNQLRKMIKTVIDQNCFVDNNVKSLKLMGKVSLIISILFIIELLFLPTPVTFVIILTFFIAGIFSCVLACVFEEAVRYKKENDLTI
ncbi:DUF2975 domain-containing protein [Clostridium sp. C105KSO13]|uniref:DUF2975 domain-containing protein n=1 Tax=Clostridium sp. C105KSO13 TaxID=1776045 RepID=UPI00074068B9|nr:DUF2975 domain-containing protein [Clostridium sp. C105KSO13]CUX26364.1 hypothetical protein BN3456_00897 [Clostridium sp. C105KSO13]